MIQDDCFLAQLVGFARQYGWEGDYFEVENFVRWVFKQLDKEPPDLAPLEEEENP